MTPTKAMLAQAKQKDATRRMERQELTEHLQALYLELVMCRGLLNALAYAINCKELTTKQKQTITKDIDQRLAESNQVLLKVGPQTLADIGVQAFLKD